GLPRSRWRRAPRGPRHSRSRSDSRIPIQHTMRSEPMNRLVRRSMVALAAPVLFAAAFSHALATGTPAGTTISNQATVNYADNNGNPLTTLSNIVTTTVSQVATVTVDPDRSSNATPGDVIYYAHDVTNGG